MHEWEREIREGVQRENWSLRGPNRIVKVLPGLGAPATALGGYITLGRFLVGKTPGQIETALGLPPGYLNTGARIYAFERLPNPSEYEYELTAKYPDGLAFNPAHGDPRYTPGHQAVHQWRILPGIHIPVDPSNFLALRPQQRFPYDWLT